MLLHEINTPKALDMVFVITGDHKHSRTKMSEQTLIRFLLLMHIGVIYTLVIGLDLPQSL